MPETAKMTAVLRQLVAANVEDLFGPGSSVVLPDGTPVNEATSFAIACEDGTWFVVEVEELKRR